MGRDSKEGQAVTVGRAPGKDGAEKGRGSGKKGPRRDLSLVCWRAEPVLSWLTPSHALLVLR